MTGPEKLELLEAALVLTKWEARAREHGRAWAMEVVANDQPSVTTAKVLAVGAYVDAPAWHEAVLAADAWVETTFQQRKARGEL